MSAPAGNFVVVLNETQDVVNIAGAVRAMMNTGLRRLRLVRPVEFNAYRIEGIAHGATVILERTEIFDDLQSALADCAHVVGATARRRSATYVWQQPREAAPELLEIAAAGGPVGLLFGREDKGLSNEDLDLCDRAITIPTDPEYASLNLAQAVLLLAYELWMAGAGADADRPAPRRRSQPVGTKAFTEMIEDARLSLERIEFFKKRNPEAILRTVRAVARRAGLDGREAKLLRAMAIEVRKYVDRKVSGR